METGRTEAADRWARGDAWPDGSGCGRALSVAWAEAERVLAAGAPKRGDRVGPARMKGEIGSTE